MTAQFSDTVTYRDQPYDLAGVSGEGLFDPFDHGLAPVSWCTACWNGYVCQYEVADDRLRLDALLVCLTPVVGPGERGETVAAPALFGRQAERIDDTFEYAYRNLAGPVAFTGGLLLGGEFIRDLYVHMGFHPAWKYERVHELIFDAGRLTSAADRSAEMRKLRESMRDATLRPSRDADKQTTMAWIEKTFSRDYRW